MQCWICGDEATTGEHMAKASDLRSMFGKISASAPLYMHTPTKRNQPVNGIKSDKLKYKFRLCPRCNNERTQPHDQAWEALSGYLRSRQPPIRPGLTVRLTPVFPGSVNRSMLNVHLFFLKLFGCLIAENSVPLTLAEFSACILKSEAHPRVHIAFWAHNERRHLRYMAQSEMQVAELGGQVAFASWFYYVGPLAINVMYAEPSERRQGLIHSWHPKNTTKLLHIRGQ